MKSSAFWVAAWFVFCCLLALLFGVSPEAHGQCVTTQRVVTNTYQPAVVAQKVVAAEVVTPVVATYVAVPVYTAVYAPPAYAPAPQQQPAQDLFRGREDRILKALEGIEGRLRALEGKAAPAPAQPAPAPATPPPAKDPFNPAPLTATSGLKVLQSRCASCHEGKVSAEKGGGLTLFDGDGLVKLTDRQSRKVVSVSYKGTMPPKSAGGPLSDAEVSAIVEVIDK